MEHSDNEVACSSVTSDYPSDDSPIAPHYSTILTSESDKESDSSFASFLEANLICESLRKDRSTFKIIIDNLDLFIRPRSETSEHHAESKHFVNVYAVKDRISCSILDNTLYPVNLSEVNIQDALPKNCDIVSRVVRKNMPYFRKHFRPKAVPKHILHTYSKE